MVGLLLLPAGYLAADGHHAASLAHVVAIANGVEIGDP
jgi:hypothetical protein